MNGRSSMSRRTVLFVAMLVLLCTASWPGSVRSASALPLASPVPVVMFEYDAMGQLTRRTAAPTAVPLIHHLAHDRLGRVVRSIDPLGNAVILAYPGALDLSQVIDPRGLSTLYSRTGLGDLVGQHSPDTGTSSFTLDAAGRVATRTDSRGVQSEFLHDAIGRLTSVVHRDPASGESESHGLIYDQTGPEFGAGIGRLTSMQFPGGTSHYSYDAQGLVVAFRQTVSAGAGTVSHRVGYERDAAGRVVRITYPSGRVLSIPHANGQAVGMTLMPTVNHAPVVLVDNLRFERTPGREGVPQSWDWVLSNGRLPHQRVFDLSGRMVRYPLGGALRDVLFDEAGRIVAYRHLDASTGVATASARAVDQVFRYDGADRVTGIDTSQARWQIDYDASGNRTGVTMIPASPSAGPVPMVSTYVTSPDSNRLLRIEASRRTFSYDQAGHLLADRQASSTLFATYTPAGRIGTLTTTRVRLNHVSSRFAYDPRGLRFMKQVTRPSCDGNSTMIDCRADLQGESDAVRRTAAGHTVVYVHDDQGRLLGEYDGLTGAVLREYVWLGSLPIALIDGPAAAPAIFYVQTDHLDTPRVVLDRQGRQRWTWVSEPFGDATPIGNPIGLGQFTLNLRMPGQYFDVEHGLSYNWHRTYDASVGRYTQSDPIGLAGGINTYAYVENNPLSYTDPDGLQVRPRPGVPGVPGITPPGGSPGGVRDPDFPPGVGPNQSPAPWWSRIFTRENCPPSADECRKRKQQCFAECQYELEFPGRSGHDNMLRFRACVRRCMNAAGCDY